jgi:hypothetical protein
MAALKTGATGRYVDQDQNVHAVLVIGPGFKVESPGNDSNGAALPPVRVPVEGIVRVRLFDEHGDSWTDEVPAARIELVSGEG